MNHSSLWAPGLVMDWVVSNPLEGFVFLLFLILWLAGPPLVFAAVAEQITMRKGRSRRGGLVLGFLVGVGSVAIGVVLGLGGNNSWDKTIAGWLVGAAALVMVAAYVPARSNSRDHPRWIAYLSRRRSDD